LNPSREEIAEFLASLKKLRDGLDDFNCQLAAIDGAGKRLGLLCEETAAACPAVAEELSRRLAGAARELRSFGGITGNVLTNFLAVVPTWRMQSRGPLGSSGDT
jgi:hypothetical protein